MHEKELKSLAYPGSTKLEENSLSTKSLISSSALAFPHSHPCLHVLRIGTGHRTAFGITQQGLGILLAPWVSQMWGSCCCRSGVMFRDKRHTALPCASASDLCSICQENHSHALAQRHLSTFKCVYKSMCECV